MHCGKSKKFVNPNSGRGGVIVPTLFPEMDLCMKNGVGRSQIFLIILSSLSTFRKSEKMSFSVILDDLKDAETPPLKLHPC